MTRRPAPRFRPPLLLVLVVAAFAAGAGHAGGGASVAGFLMDLHLHGSISEGFGTMRNHIQQASAAGYDGLWWTDHMTRQSNDYFPLHVPLDDSLEGPLMPPPVNLPELRLVEGGPDPDLLDLAFLGAGAMEGTGFLRVTADGAPLGGGAHSATLSAVGYHRGHRQGLLAEPVFSCWMRLENLSGAAGVLFRARVSGIPDGATREGTPQYVELVPANLPAPPPGPNATRIASAALPIGQWTLFQVALEDLIGIVPLLQLDMSIIELEFEFHSTGGGSVTIDLDAVELDREGPSGGAMYLAQQQLLGQLPTGGMFHRVGAEVEGPLDQFILGLSSRDHLVALYPGITPAAISFPAGSPAAMDYPASGVQAIQAAGGAAILAHLYGSGQDHVGTGIVLAPAIARRLADRVVKARAWGADAMEVGYVRRERPLADFVRVWDRLSEEGVYVTGVASSDNHDLEPWSQRLNRWGSWLVASSSTGADLVAAVRGGTVYFGDPHRFDVDGVFVLEEPGGAFSMGDVVPVPPAGSTVDLLVSLSGAAGPGDEVVVFHNGAETDRRPVGASGALSVTLALGVTPGDWLRAELRDAQDEAYVFTNPVYFVATGDPVPGSRAAGPLP